MKTTKLFFTILILVSSFLFGCSKDDKSSLEPSSNLIAGVWINFGNRGILTDAPKFNWRIFFEDGSALLTIPDGGFYNFTNVQGLENYIGQYQYSNSQGTLKYGNNLQFTDNIVFKSQDVITIQD